MLVEGDPRRPTVADLVQVQSGIGLADVLAERSPLDDAIQATHHANLSILASSDAAGPEWHFGTALLARTVEKLCARFDWVFIEAPPALVNADAGMLAGSVQATVLVVRAGKTTVDEVTAAIESLRVAGGNVVGTVMIDAPVSRQLRAAARRTERRSARRRDQPGRSPRCRGDHRRARRGVRAGLFLRRCLRSARTCARRDFDRRARVPRHLYDQTAVDGVDSTVLGVRIIAGNSPSATGCGRFRRTPITSHSYLPSRFWFRVRAFGFRSMCCRPSFCSRWRISPSSGLAGGNDPNG